MDIEDCGHVSTLVCIQRFRLRGASARLVVVSLLLGVFAFASPARAQERLCDPGAESCRDILISYIDAETVGVDVAFWFMEDARYTSALQRRVAAGVPVRVIMDSRANPSYPLNVDRLAELQTAGIPMRERFSGGIMHWKMMLFAGQGVVQFSGANYSSDAWRPTGDPFTNYTDESIFFTSASSIVNSFRTKFDDLWMDTTAYRDYANVPATRTRQYDVYPRDPELNFPPSESFANRSVSNYNLETEKIDVIMYRVTDQRHTNAMIAARNRGIPVRLISEPKQYRDPTRLWHSWNIDRMYMAGVQIKHRQHAGLNHQKSVLLYGLGMTIFGSSNWTSPSSSSQEEHNLFTFDATRFNWFAQQFERKWNNSAGVIENVPFSPLPPDAPTTPSPVTLATDISASSVLTLKWYGGRWSHLYDVYLGTDSGSLPLVAPRLALGPSESSSQMQSYTVASGSLLPGTTYYWKVVGRTMAEMTMSSAVWSFTTAGTAPPPVTATVVREPYLQQVTSSGAVIVWATRESGAGEVRVTPPSSAAITVPATTTRFTAAATGQAQDYYQHVASVSGLTASTTYQYDIIVSGIDVNPVLDTFRTAPARGTGSVSFVAFGDSGTGSPEQMQIASLLDGEAFDLALHAGDLAYGNGGGTGAATHSTTDSWFFSVYRNWLRSRPVFPSLGNHDSRLENSNGQPYRDLFVLPEHGATAAYPDHAERYYSFDYGPIHVVVLDTELAFQDASRQAAQVSWADADLAASSQPWKIAVFHRAPYSSGGEHGSDLAVRSAFAPLLERRGVQLAVTAHEHDYERTVPLAAGVPASGGVTYVVTGGGGGPLYPAAASSWTAYSASRHHYVRASVTDCVLQLDAVALDRSVFDTVSLRRCDPPADTQLPVASITSPAAGATVRGSVAVSVTATDNVAVASVELLVDGAVVGSDSSAPFSFTWDAGAVSNGSHTLQARATDTAGNMATSALVGVTVDNPVAGAADIVLYAGDATRLFGGWRVEADSSAAGGKKARHPNAGTPKLATALASPAAYFEMTFTPQVDVPYRLWIRGRADSNGWANDSVYVQFSGASNYAIGTTSATEINLEDCSGCGLTAWGWQDNGWGVGVMGPTITFTTGGIQTIRIQTREDGLSIDQIMLSPSRFLTSSPGALKSDATIYPRANGGSPPAPDTVKPSVSIAWPAAGSTVAGVVTVAVSATDNVGVTRVDVIVDGAVVGTTSAAPYGVSWNTSSFTNAGHVLEARAFDAAGNQQVSVALAVTVNNAPAGDTQAPTATLTSPANGAIVSGVISPSANASDNVAVTRVELLVNGSVVSTISAPPYVFTWDTRALANGSYSLEARAFDAAGLSGTSSTVLVTVDNVAAPAAEIVLYAADAPTVSGRWVKELNSLAAGGALLRHPNQGEAKRTVALAAPSDFFELTFVAEAGVPYHLWIRGKADSNSHPNDSVFVQFSGATDYQIGTTAAAEMNLEDCSGCGLSKWGWQDNGWGAGVAGPNIVFTSAGPQKIRIQTREDGLSIDQIILSPSRYLTTAPGPLKNDATIVPR